MQQHPTATPDCNTWLHFSSPQPCTWQRHKCCSGPLPLNDEVSKADADAANLRSRQMGTSVSLSLHLPTPFFYFLFFYFFGVSVWAGGGGGGAFQPITLRQRASVAATTSCQAPSRRPIWRCKVEWTSLSWPNIDGWGRSPSPLKVAVAIWCDKPTGTAAPGCPCPLSCARHQANHVDTVRCCGPFRLKSAFLGTAAYRSYRCNLSLSLSLPLCLSLSRSLSLSLCLSVSVSLCLSLSLSLSLSL